MTPNINDINMNASRQSYPPPPTAGSEASAPISPIKQDYIAQYIVSVMQSFNTRPPDEVALDNIQPGNPTLPSPLDSSRGTRKGAERAIQDLVIGFIAKEINLLLPQLAPPAEANAIFALLIQGGELKDPKLQNIANQIRSQVEAKVKKEFRLENFTLEALYTPNEKAWIQTPLAPYGKEKKAEINEFYNQSLQKNLGNFLTNALPKDAALMEDYAIMKERLTMAVNGGHVHPTIKAALAEIKKISIQETQQKFGLPISWKPGTSEVDDWKPVNLGPVSVNAIGAARTERLLQNFDTVLKNLSKAGEALLEKLPENDSRKPEVEDYISAIIDAIYDYQKQLQEYQFLLAQQSQEHMDNILDIQETRNATYDEKSEEAKKTMKKQSNMETFSKVMAVVGPAIAFVSLAIAALTWWTGVGGAIAVAGLLVAGAMLAYTVTDSVVGATTGTSLTAQAMEGLNDLIDQLPGSDLNKALAKALAVAAVVVFIAAMVALVVVTAGASSSVAAQVIVSATKQLSIQASMILIMGSGVLMEIPSEALKATGLDNTTIDILKYAIIALEMLAVLAVAMKATSSAMKVNPALTPEEAAKAAAEEAAKAAAKAAGQTSQSLSQKVTSGIKAFGTSSKESIEEAINGAIKGLEDFAKSLTYRIQHLDTILPDSKDWLIGFLKANVELFASRTKKENLLFILNRFGAFITPAVNTASNAYMAYGHYQLYELLKQTADTEEMLAEIQAMLDLLNNVVKQLQAAMQGNTEDILIFTDTFDSLMKSLSESTKNLVQAAPVMG